MKKLITAAALALAIVLTSCTSIRQESLTNEIKSEKIALNTYFDKNEYSIIGTVNGESDFVWYNSRDTKYEGDSGKYGYIYEPTAVNVGEGLFVGTGKKLIGNVAEEEVLRRAKLNANYELIQAAYAKGGDYILEPVYTVETKSDSSEDDGVKKVKVTVRAKVIQLKAR